MTRHSSLLTLTVCAFLIAGCGQKTKKQSAATSTEGPDATSIEFANATRAQSTLTIWWAQFDPAQSFGELSKEFTDETGIKVNLHLINWGSYQDQVFLEFGNKQTAFDIVVGDSQWLGKGATEGLYVDITKWLPTVMDISKIHPQARKYLCEYPTGSGKFFAAPCLTDAVGVAYRKDWFEDPAELAAFKAKYGRDLAVPKTWDKFVEVAEFFTRPDEQRYGCVILTGRSYDALVMGFQQVMWAFGGSWKDAETLKVQGHVNSPASEEALTFYKSLLAYTPKGGGNIDYDRILESYKDTKSTAMLMTYFAHFPTIDKSEVGPNTGYFVVPSKDGKHAVSLGGQGMSISAKASPNQQAIARRFITWFLQRKTQDKWIQKPGGFTAHTDVLASEAFRNASRYNPAFAESLDHVQDFWNIPQYNELLSIAMRRLGEALDDDAISAKAALDKIADEHAQVLADEG